MIDKRIKEIFDAPEEMVKAALDLEISCNTKFSRVIYTKNKRYRFSVKLDPLKEEKNK